MLTQERVIEQTKLMLGWRTTEAKRCDHLHDYIRGKQKYNWLTSAAPDEARLIAKISRVNVLELVIDSVAQSMYVDGFRAKKSEDEDPAWEVWQRNRMDARQIGVHRAALSYGASYVTVMPGDPVPVLTGISPRNLTAVYGEDDAWPVWALEKRRSATKDSLYRLYDDEAVYYVNVDVAGKVTYISDEIHGLGKVPVVRFLNKSDLDDEVISETENLENLQDQINLTSFNLKMAEHFGAFPQKWITGWTPEVDDEKEAQKELRKVGVNRILAFPDPETRTGAFEAADLSGYIESREASLRHLAAISQTPAHALRGELVNLSAEALAAAEATERRKIDERTALAGESWEQVLALAGKVGGYDTDPQAQVRWRDTESRAYAATVDALGKLATMLQVPVEELWEKIPNTTKQDVDRYKAARQNGDALGRLTQELARQSSQLTLGV